MKKKKLVVMKVPYEFAEIVTSLSKERKKNKSDILIELAEDTYMNFFKLKKKDRR